MAGYGSMYGRQYREQSYASDPYSRQAIYDAEVRRRPTGSYAPHTDSFVAETETVYKYSSPTMVEPLRDYGVVEDKWRNPASPVYDRPQRVEEFIPPRSGQTEASRPNRFGPMNATQWRQTPNSYQGYNGYGENYDDYYRKSDNQTQQGMINTGGWTRPSHATWNSPPSGSYARPTTEPSSVSSTVTSMAVEYLKDAALKEVAKPSPVTSVAMQCLKDSVLKESSKPSPVTAVAMELLKEATKPSSAASSIQRPWLSRSSSASPVANRDEYAETIDNRDVSRRYGNFKLRPRPAETY